MVRGLVADTAARFIGECRDGAGPCPEEAASVVGGTISAATPLTRGGVCAVETLVAELAWESSRRDNSAFIVASFTVSKPSPSVWLSFAHKFGSSVMLDCARKFGDSTRILPLQYLISTDWSCTLSDEMQRVSRSSHNSARTVSLS